MAIRSEAEALPTQTHSADISIVSTHSADVSILRPKIDRSGRRVAGIDMARELRGAHGHVLTPGRYVGPEEIEDDGVLFEEKMAEQYVGADEQMTEAWELDGAIRRRLEVRGHGE